MKLIHPPPPPEHPELPPSNGFPGGCEGELPPMPQRPRRRWLARIVLGGLLLIVLAVGGVIYLVRTPPAHWKRYEQFKAAHTTEQIEAMAQGMENRLNALIESDLAATAKVDSGGALDAAAGGSAALTDEQGHPVDLSMVRIDEIRTMQLTRDEMTALITARHKQWLESRGYVKPEELSDLMIDLEDGGLIASFKYESRHFSQVFSTRFKLNFQEDGTAVIQLNEFSAGRMPIPADKIGQYLRDKGGDSSQADQAGEWLQKMDDFRFKPVLDDLPHRRRARILNYIVNKSDIELTLRVQDFRTYQETNGPSGPTGDQTASASGE